MTPDAKKKTTLMRAKNGVAVQFVELRGFYSVYVSVSIRAGGNDRVFWQGERLHALPAGAAHFLEHLIFSGENDGLVDSLALKGISTNALTTYEETIFYTKGVGQALAQVKALLKAIFQATISEADVERERPVIRAELDMMNNDPATILQNTLLQTLYARHPLRDDIGGSEEDIRHLTSQDLASFRQSYYAGDLVIVTVAGDVSEDEQAAILAEVERVVPKKTCPNPPPRESDLHTPWGKTEKIAWSVDLPQFGIGIKIDPKLWPTAYEERYLAWVKLLFWLNTAYGDVAETFDEMSRTGLIDDSFQHTLWQGDDYSTLLFFGHSAKPEAATEMILETLETTLTTPPSPDLFDLVRRQALGKLMRRQDSVSGLGSYATFLARRGMDVLSLAEHYAKMEFPQVDELSQSLLSKANRATVILLPKSP